VTHIQKPDCGCYRCVEHVQIDTGLGKIPFAMTRMIVCETCGGKRCPHSTDHNLECTGSNEPGQKGSRYE
jgi:hypothetical protein